VLAPCEYGLVGVGGFEPPTSWSQTTRSSLAELHPAKLSVHPQERGGQAPGGTIAARLGITLARETMAEARGP
jgi:hypothetical protein